MALVGSHSGAADLVVAALAALSEEDLQDNSKTWAAVFQALFSHINLNAEISTTVAVVSVAGVTAGPATSGPGAGTGTGKIL